MARKKKGMIRLEEKAAVLFLPAESVEILITAQVYHRGRLQEVSRKLSMDEVQKAFNEAEEGYLPEDSTFTLTEAGKKYLEDLEMEQRELCKQG